MTVVEIAEEVDKMYKEVCRDVRICTIVVLNEHIRRLNHGRD